MLQFYYDFLDNYYLEHSDFQCAKRIAPIYRHRWGQCRKFSETRLACAEYQRDKNNWFPRTDTQENKAYDKRTPGLFKEEQGQGIIWLSSKTYYCFIFLLATNDSGV